MEDTYQQTQDSSATLLSNHKMTGTKTKSGEIATAAVKVVPKFVVMV
jgi:hypothetical protein